MKHPDNLNPGTNLQVYPIWHSALPCCLTDSPIPHHHLALLQPRAMGGVYKDKYNQKYLRIGAPSPDNVSCNVKHWHNAESTRDNYPEAFSINSNNGRKILKAGKNKSYGKKIINGINC